MQVKGRNWLHLVSISHLLHYRGDAYSLFLSKANYSLSSHAIVHVQL